MREVHLAVIIDYHHVMVSLSNHGMGLYLKMF